MKFKEYIYKYIYNILYIPGSFLGDPWGIFGGFLGDFWGIFLLVLRDFLDFWRIRGGFGGDFGAFDLHFGHSQLSKLLVRAQVLGPWLHHSDDFVRGRHGKYFNSGDSSNTN